MRNKPYIFYLQNTVTGTCLYVDSSGNIQETSIMAAGTAQDVSLKNAPDGWMEATLGYSRNAKYYGFNRSYSDPLKLVKDAAFIARTKFYLGTGIETKLSLLILKYNQNPAAGEPLYKLYHRAPIDFPRKNDKVAEGFSCSLLEGGILQMLKTYENTVFQIPCDGSIPENIKVNMDGMYVQDTFNYQIMPAAFVTSISDYFTTVPAVFISNDGDNIGIIHNDPISENVTSYAGIPGYTTTSPNYIFSAVRPTQVRIKGLMNVQSGANNFPVDFGFNYYTSQTIVTGSTSTHSGSLLANADDSYKIKGIMGMQTIYFDRTISLAAGETLFLAGCVGGPVVRIMSISGGNFTMQFPSIAATTAPWCITAYDLFKLIIKNINQVASSAFQTFTFGADSQYLQDKLNLVVTSGDALRASGDPNYQKFYNTIQANPAFPNVNIYNSYGPVIKTSLSDFFTSFDAILNASLGNQTLPGEGETVFFERKGYVFNSTVDTFDLGEVSDFNVTVDMEKLFTILKIGYPEQSYDQKAGKYEWNTSLEMISPIDSIPTKKLEITSRYRADAYGIERLRSNLDNTSTQRNNSDNSVFVINTDRTSSIYDYFESGFTSTLIDPTNSANTNIRLLNGQLNQPLPMQMIRSGYFSINNDPSIFILSQAGLSSSKTLAINISGNLNGSPFNALTMAPADTVTINIFLNGTIVKTYTTTATSPSTPIIITDSLTRTWNTNDVVYIQANTSATGIAILDSVSLNLGSGYYTASGASITVEAGSSCRMIALPTVSAPLVSGLPVLSYGFQYFQFNSALANQNFKTTFGFAGTFNGSNTPGVEVDLYVNGILNSGLTSNVSGFWQTFSGGPSFTRNWSLGDIMFCLASTFSTVQVQMQVLDLKVVSTQIQAFSLKRLQYDYISGLPALCGYVTTPQVIGGITVQVPTAIPVTTGAGAPYNIEDLSPKRMLMAWGNYLRSILWDQQSGVLQFSTLTKNQYLITKSGTTVFAENAPVRVSDMDAPLFTLNKATFKTRVPLFFEAMMRQSVNAFLSWTYNGLPYYGFAEDMKQKSTLNEMQSWEALIA
jgi:hypothetical protein